MTKDESMTSNKPYLIRALNEWIVYPNYLEMQTSELSQEDRARRNVR